MQKTQFFQNIINSLQPLCLLVIRLYISMIFLKSGVQKITNWDSTLYLFEYEYHVPFIPFKIAAILGTSLEFILPIILIVGLFSRLGAFLLFIFNIVAVISYSAITKGDFSVIMAFDFLPIGLGFPTKGFEDHFSWGLMLLALVAFGAGKISFDYLFFKKNETKSHDIRITQ